MENNSINTLNEGMTESIEDALNEGLEKAAESTVNSVPAPATTPVPTAAPAAGSSNKGLVIGICIAAGVLTLGAGGFIAYKLWRKKHPKEDTEEGKDEKK